MEECLGHGGRGAGGGGGGGGRRGGGGGRRGVGGGRRSVGGGWEVLLVGSPGVFVFQVCSVLSQLKKAVLENCTKMDRFVRFYN